MGWALKLDSGKWRAMYRDNAGKQRSAGVFTHKVKATRAAGVAEAKARGTYWRSDEARSQSWGQWADEVWWPSRTVAATTAKSDRLRRANHLDPRWAAVPIGSITRSDVKRWAADLAASGLGPESVRRCVALLSSSLKAAVDSELLDFNPARELGLPTGATDQERFLTRGEFDVLAAWMPTERDLLIVEMLAYTGLRWGELAGLHRARVDTARQMIRVVETFDETAGRIKAKPKSEKPRDVPLPAFLARKIERVGYSGPDCGVEHAMGRCPGPLLVPSDKGGPLRSSNWSGRVWRRAVADAEIGHVRIHDLRHTYASWLLQDGISLAEVQRLLGHASASTTERYAHLAAIPSSAVLAALGESATRLPHDRRALGA